MQLAILFIAAFLLVSDASHARFKREESPTKEVVEIKGGNCLGAGSPNIPVQALDCPPPGGDRLEEGSEGKYQGDIAGIPTGSGSNRNAIRNIGQQWPKSSDGKVYIPYQIRALNTEGRTAVKNAIDQYNKNTCIRFVERRSESDYLDIIPTADGCYSQVGRSDPDQQPQVVSLGSGCEYTSTAVHELMHAIGFLHEQSRPDRDDFITIVTENIKQGFADQFEKGDPSQYSTQDLPYEYESVMQYATDAFSIAKGQKMTMVPKKAGVTTLGNKVGMTATDIKKINKLYNCDNTNPGAKSPKDVKDGYNADFSVQISDAQGKAFLKKVEEFGRRRSGSMSWDASLAKRAAETAKGLCTSSSYRPCGEAYAISMPIHVQDGEVALSQLFKSMSDTRNRGGSQWLLNSNIGTIGCGDAACGDRTGRLKHSIVCFGLPASQGSGCSDVSDSKSCASAKSQAGAQLCDICGPSFTLGATKVSGLLCKKTCGLC